jgi:hypothetical protein
VWLGHAALYHLPLSFQEAQPRKPSPGSPAQEAQPRKHSPGALQSVSSYGRHPCAREIKEARSKLRKRPFFYVENKKITIFPRTSLLISAYFGHTSSQVKFLIYNESFFTLQRATAQPTTCFFVVVVMLQRTLTNLLACQTFLDIEPLSSNS